MTATLTALALTILIVPLARAIAHQHTPTHDPSAGATDPLGSWPHP